MILNSKKLESHETNIYRIEYYRRFGGSSPQCRLCYYPARNQATKLQSAGVPTVRLADVGTFAETPFRGPEGSK
jgi:hypothetical protein